MADTAPPAANGGSMFENTKANAAAAFNSMTGGPVAQNVKDHTRKASAEFSNLAASRRTPDSPAATGQPLTHYHSFFYELLSWKNPRASAIALGSIISAIFVGRYVDIYRRILQLTWMALGITVSAEAAGKFLLNKGLATSFRPRQYYTVSRETLESWMGDLTELINFVVIESQRILFVENISASFGVAFLSFLTYHLTKIVPYWGLAIMGTLLAFIAPLVYVTNQELIDHHLKNAGEVIDAQTAQVRSVAQKQAESVTAIGKQYAGDYTGKVQEMLRGGRKTSNPTFPTAPTEEPKNPEIPEVPLEDPSLPAEPPLVS
jgi:hypothetical protein